MPQTIKNNRKASYPIDSLYLNRWSRRAFSEESISADELMPLFEAARWAPSSFNAQPWRFIYAFKGSQEWAQLYDCLASVNRAWAVKAAVLVLVLSKKAFERNGKPNRHHSFDTGAAWQNLALQASQKGFVTHAMAGFSGDQSRQTFRFPEEYEPEIMIAIGKPGKTEDLPESLRDAETPSMRKNLDEIAFRGSWKG